MKFRFYYIVFFVVVFFSHGANAQDTLYSQSVIRDDPYFCDILYLRRGKIILTKDSLIFYIAGKRGRRYNFSEALENIKEIKKAFVPNRIIIRTFSGNSYRLYTYKRKKLIEYARNEITKKSKPN